MLCLRCQTPMVDEGVMRLHEGLFFVTKEPFHMLRCPACGKVEFFIQPPDALLFDHGSEGAIVTEEVECLECGEIIAPGAERCEKCGWTWRTSEI